MKRSTLLILPLLLSGCAVANKANEAGIDRLRAVDETIYADYLSLAKAHHAPAIYDANAGTVNLARGQSDALKGLNAAPAQAGQ